MKVSVIVPAYNAEEEISRVLDALLGQNYDGDYEIIVVDDGSSDNTEKVIRDFEENHESLRLITQKNQGPAAARNRGAEEASGKYLLFTDSDCVPEPDWISQMVSSLEKNGVIGVQGRYKCLNNDSLLARFIQYEIEERYNRMERKGNIDFIGSYSAGYVKEVFLDMEGFDESFKSASGEDPELSYRLDERGHRMVFNPKAIVKHEHPTSLKKYIKMKFRRGYWGVPLYRKHPKKKGGQSYNSPLYFYHIPFTLLLFTLALISIPFSPSTSAILLGIIGLSNLPSSLYFSKFESKFIIISVVFITLRNLSYGIGIVFGILRWGIP